MVKTIKLSEQEATLRQLLLDVSTYIGTLDGLSKPQLRFTGGWVRDKLLGVGSKDIDIGIDSMTGFKFGTLMNQYLEQPEAQAKHPKSVLGRLAKIEANPEKSKHLETVTTKILGYEIDLVNLRKETYAEDSRNPQMEFGTPEEDALRRDATVNALFYNLEKSEVEDFTDRGLRDMERQIIKTPLDPYRTFMDDPLRVLRAIRFASRLGWRIDKGDEQAMSDGNIRDALKLKITRERVGIELTKMLKDPHPHRALRFIDRLGLYHTVFTMFNDELAHFAKTENWKRAYDQLHVLVSAEMEALTKPPTENTKRISNSLKSIRSTLLRDIDDVPANVYHAWLLCAFVPWARVVPAAPQNSKGKVPSRPAALVARDGIKADNNTVRLIENAVVHLDAIIQHKNVIVDEVSATTSPLKRKQESATRSEQGMAIRRWGPRWRSSVMFAILTQVMETPEEGHEELLEGYAQWLSKIKDLDLLEAYQLKPLVTGDKLSKALDAKPGPWMSKALEMVIAWQLANPGEQDPEAAISEVKGRKKDLGLVITFAVLVDLRTLWWLANTTYWGQLKVVEESIEF
ncbi:MAG: hypothetical protein LQ338_005339 [Usnochroma carphineum]|nr:MAG: hypothetical protein LQ338_005339 [Usnochroma carphineum]